MKKSVIFGILSVPFFEKVVSAQGSGWDEGTLRYGILFGATIAGILLYLFLRRSSAQEIYQKYRSKVGVPNANTDPFAGDLPALAKAMTLTDFVPSREDILSAYFLKGLREGVFHLQFKGEGEQAVPVLVEETQGGTDGEMKSLMGILDFIVDDEGCLYGKTLTIEGKKYEEELLRWVEEVLERGRVSMVSHGYLRGEEGKTPVDILSQKGLNPVWRAEGFRHFILRAVGSGDVEEVKRAGGAAQLFHPPLPGREEEERDIHPQAVEKLFREYPEFFVARHMGEAFFAGIDEKDPVDFFQTGMPGVYGTGR